MQLLLHDPEVACISQSNSSASVCLQFPLLRVMRTLETSIVEAKVNTGQFSAIFTFADAHWQNFLSLVDESNDHHFKKKKKTNSKEREVSLFRKYDTF